MVLALSTNANATAQKHRHTPRTEQVSDTVKHNQDAIEAFSDTTATNNANADDNDNDSGYRRHVVYEGEDAERVVSGIFGDMDGAAFMGLLIPILAIVCVGFLLPVILVLLVFYAPKFGTSRGAMVSIVLALLGTVGWYLADNPFDIDNAYLAIAIPIVVMTISHFFRDPTGNTGSSRPSAHQLS